MEFSNVVTLVVIVPETHADKVREALGRAGAGKVGNYTHCSFSVKGSGRFLPQKGARPFIGEEGKLETVAEERIETVCDRSILPRVIVEVRKAHPYEEPSIDVYPMWSTV